MGTLNQSRMRMELVSCLAKWGEDFSLNLIKVVNLIPTDDSEPISSMETKMRSEGIPETMIIPVLTFIDAIIFANENDQDVLN